MNSIWVLLLFLPAALADIFTEDLVISRLPSGDFLSQFRFSIASKNLVLEKEYELFPRVMAELITQYSVEELSLSLGMGRWFTEKWGIPPQPSSPPGAYVSAQIRGNETEVDEKWTRIINSLNGIVCTSLTAVIPSLTASPVHLAKFSGNKDSKFRYAALARETVCTENLTPWRKLLPCKQNGLTTLLNPLKLYDSNFQSMGLHIYKDNKNKQWRIEFTLDLVSFGITTRLNEADIETLYGRKIVGICQAADSSSVWIEASSISEAPPGAKLINGFVKYNVNDEKTPRNLRVDLQENYLKNDFPVSSVTSQLGGVGEYSGTLVTYIKNAGEARRAVFTHVIPWFIRVHYHTLMLECEHKHQSLKPEIYAQSFIPAISRQKPAVIEYDFQLPANAQCRVSFYFKKAFLRLREYPPDAHHGMYIPSAILTMKEFDDLSYPGNQLNRKEGAPLTIYGNALLVVLPVPDFSMPFNVICFVLTTITLCFGPIHNFSTKVLIPLNTKMPVPPIMRKIVRGILLVLLGLAVYAQYNEIGLNEIRRIINRAIDDIKEGFEKMNSL